MSSEKRLQSHPSLQAPRRGACPGKPTPTSSHQELGLPATQAPSGQHHPHPQDPVGTLESRRGRMLRAGGPRPERGWGGGNQKREDPALPGAGPFSGCCLPRAARVRVPQVPKGFPCREGGFSFLKRPQGHLGLQMRAARGAELPVAPPTPPADAPDVFNPLDFHPLMAR